VLVGPLFGLNLVESPVLFRYNGLYIFLAAHGLGDWGGIHYFF
jgi:hypothetical protein